MSTTPTPRTDAVAQKEAAEHVANLLAHAMTEPRKTPRSDKAAILIEDSDYGDVTEYVKSDFARALEIETQELADLLDTLRPRTQVVYRDTEGRSEMVPTELTHRVDAALARHRAKQEGRK